MDWKHTAIASVVLLAAGLALGGWFVGQGIAGMRVADRSVMVKGLAERTATADVALWSIRFGATNDALAQAQQKLAADAARIRAFLAAAGVAENAVRVGSIRVVDQFAQQFRNGPVQSRYILDQTLVVRSEDVQGIAAAAERVGELVAGGVVLNNEGGDNAPVYLFTGLNAIKPAMIAEATKNARDGAQQFARDSGRRIGGIRRASQGIFEILPRDPAPGMGEAGQIMKTVRVVSTIHFDILD